MDPLKEPGSGIRLCFDPLAFVKMQTLICSFDSEVAWHGTAVRIPCGYLIKDILVYPQEVNSSTVRTSQEEYERWLMGLDDERFEECRMQGHSHGNGETSPSGVDLAHQNSILEQLEPEDFYIFMIWNKKMKRSISIFDRKLGKSFKNEDIRLYAGDSFDPETFTEEAREVVRKRNDRSDKIVRIL